MKSFILRTGEFLVKVGVVVGILVSLILAYAYARLAVFASPGAQVLMFLLMAAIGVCAVVLTAFFLFLLIDIRDELRKLNEKTGGNIQ